MKTAGGLAILFFATVAGGCRVDISQLRAADAKRPDAASDVTPGGDVTLSGQPDTRAPDSDGPLARTDAWIVEAGGVPGDVPAVEASADGPGLDDRPPMFDAALVDAPVLPEDATSAPDDLAAPGEDSAQSSFDAVVSALDAGLDATTETSGDARLLPDAGEGTSDAADAALATDVPPDTGGRPNGSSCSSADQCQSGFCVGTTGRCCSQSCTSACYRPNVCTTGSCVPVQGAIACGDLDAICGLSVNDWANASDWSLRANLQVGDQATSTDPHLLSSVPTELAGSPWIRPSRQSKTATGNPLVTFTLSNPADVYVGIDTRLTAPAWMASWTDSQLTIAYRVVSVGEPTSTVTQRLWRARLPAGDVELGPLACINTSTCSMYLTVVRFVDQPIGTPPSCQ
jgi:hypothetical protein